MQRPVVQNAFCIRNFFEAARTVAGGQRKRGSLVEKVFGKQKAFTAGLISHSVGEFFYGTDLAGQQEPAIQLEEAGLFQNTLLDSQRNGTVVG